MHRIIAAPTRSIQQSIDFPQTKDTPPQTTDFRQTVAAAAALLHLHQVDTRFSTLQILRKLPTMTSAMRRRMMELRAGKLAWGWVWVWGLG